LRQESEGHGFSHAENGHKKKLGFSP